MNGKYGFFGTLVFLVGIFPAWGQEPANETAPLQGQLETSVGEVEQDTYLVREKEVVSDSEAGKKELILQTVGMSLPTDFRLVGEVKYEGVEGQGYLEMLVDHGERGDFFSRTLSEHGPMGYLEGDSDWRPFELPFHGGGNDIKMNVVLPGKGKVWVKKVRLVEGEETSGAWFSERQAGAIGGWIGAICGVFGGIIGFLAGMLVPKGRGRGLILGLLGALAVSGFVLVLIAFAAMLDSQPWHVQYVFWLTGGLDFILALILIPIMNRQYSAVELRRMEAMDAG